MKIERTIPIPIAALGIIVASVGLVAVDRFLIEAGAVVTGMIIFGAGYVWYHRQWDQSDRVRVDERIEQISYRSGEIAFRVSLGLAMALFVAVEAETVPITAGDGLVLLILSMVVTRFGLYGWFRQQSM